jgi:hypothetical protein
VKVGDVCALTQVAGAGVPAAPAQGTAEPGSLSIVAVARGPAVVALAGPAASPSV